MGKQRKGKEETVIAPGFGVEFLEINAAKDIIDTFIVSRRYENLCFPNDKIALN